MKSRGVLIGLAVLTLISMTTAGYLYYTLEATLQKQSMRQGSTATEILQNRISSFLSENLKAVKAMAGLRELRQALETPDIYSVAQANAILDHFRNALGVDVCYLMDQDGKTIAASNRDSADSFVGKNYGFRPYFQQAFQGQPGVYMALGVTSTKPGAYYSHPVYKEGQASPIGVAVIKSSVETVEGFFRQSPERIMLMVDPHGVVFLANRQEWLYRTLWKVSPEEITKIEKTQQFGKGPWEWSGLQIKEGDRAVDSLGNRYLTHQVDIGSYPGWRVISLNPSGDF